MLLCGIMDNKNFGDYAEDYAVKYYLSKGYKIITRNFRTHLGEIDIICRNKDNLIFIEVKARHSLKYGYPEESVNKLKLSRMIKTINYYCRLNKCENKKFNIEVFSYLLEKDGKITTKIISVDNIE